MGLYRVHIGLILGLYCKNGKDAGNYCVTVRAMG